MGTAPLGIGGKQIPDVLDVVLAYGCGLLHALYHSPRGQKSPAKSARMSQLQNSPFCHSRNDSERESGSNGLKNHIPDRGIRE